MLHQRKNSGRKSNCDLCFSAFCANPWRNANPWRSQNDETICSRPCFHAHAGLLQVDPGHGARSPHPQGSFHLKQMRNTSQQNGYMCSYDVLLERSQWCLHLNFESSLKPWRSQDTKQKMSSLSLRLYCSMLLCVLQWLSLCMSCS